MAKTHSSRLRTSTSSKPPERSSTRTSKAKAKPHGEKKRRASPEEGACEDPEIEYVGEDASDDTYEDGNGHGVGGSKSNSSDGDVDNNAFDASEDEKTKRGKKRKPGGCKGSLTNWSTNKTRRGQVTAVKMVQGPGKDEMVDPGVIAPFTMAFLKDLSDTTKNDRDWLALNDPVYRASLANWHDFVTCFVPKLSEADWTIPSLPSKDLVHRIYRDVRFSNDKTPYKTNFSAGFTRTGRKGPWAGYYIHIQPDGQSLLAGGKWCPEKNDLATIRSAILCNPQPLRKAITSKEFVEMFGKAEECKGKNKRQNVFGHEDALKNGPKMEGVTKDHKDIDLLKLKTIAAVKYFPDSVVLSQGFVDELAKVAKVLAPLVQCLNEMILPQSDDETQEGENEDMEDEAKVGDEEAEIGDKEACD